MGSARRLLSYVDADETAVRADMPDLIRFALGSGLRIGEICAVRWMDIDLDGIPVVMLRAGVGQLSLRQPVQ